MNQYSNIRKELSMQEISPAWGFAKYMSDNHPQIKTGIVVNARGGSAMEGWMPGQSLYNNTVTRATETLKWGEFKGILWHQGESNSSSDKVAAYPNQLKSMVQGLRVDLSAPDAYFLAGELIHTWNNSANFNTMIQTVSSFIDKADWVSALNLTPRTSGDVHFSREGNIVLGERYAKKIVSAVYGSTSAQEKKPDNGNIMVVDNNKIIISNTTSDSYLSVFDTCGKNILSEAIGSSYSFSLHRQGIYIVFLKNNHAILVRKILVK